MFYAYVHCKPDGTPFYVGKGVRSRYKNFKYRNQYHKRVVAKYGEKNILIGKIDVSTNENALLLEVGIIKCLKRMNVTLTNLTDGGEGSVGRTCPDNVKRAVSKSNKNRIWTEEQRLRMGDNSRGKKRPKHSEIMKEKKLFVGEKNPFYGKGFRQLGDKNHMARAVRAVDKNGNVRTWATLKYAADELGVTIQAVCQAIKKGHRSKGWFMEYAK